jgi:sigma-B regulation protein RsbU (phosphoserine phosphatase)
MALEVARTASPDLVLLDVMMPNLDGIETCRRLRADPRHEHLAILMQTALDDPDMRADCFAAGATDFVTKPINLPEVVARVRVHLENRRLLRSLEDFHARMKLHLSLVGRLADSMLPDADDLARLHRNTGLTVDTFRRSTEEVGGDFWTLRDFGDGRAVIILADAVGHGLAATINALRVEAVLRELPEYNVSALLAALDDRLVALDDGRLTAAVVAVDYDAARSVATVCAAGAPTPLLLRGRRVAPVETGGLPVGTGLFTPRNHSIALEPGDSLVLYSDGWAAGDPERAAAIVRDAAAAGGIPSAAHLASRGGDGPVDDLTVLILSRR